MYNYLKALHIIFIVTWFSGMFYIVRLFIYAAEANQKKDSSRGVLVKQYNIMAKRLWLGITWPSAILTAIFGPLLLFQGPWNESFAQQEWLHVKLGFVVLLYLYFYSLHRIYKQQQRNVFKVSPQRLRIWNEVATVFLVAIVMLAVVKNAMSWLWGLIGLIALMVVLMSAIKIYKAIRAKNT